jgi:hypothetical protein
MDVLPSTPELLRGDQGGQARLERVQLARPRRARVDAPRTAASALTSTADLVSALAALLTAGSGSLQIWLSQRHLLGPAVGSPILLRAPVPARSVAAVFRTGPEACEAALFTSMAHGGPPTH